MLGSANDLKTEADLQRLLNQAKDELKISVDNMIAVLQQAEF